MSDNPFFSLLIGTLDRPEILYKCLKTLENQTFKHFEVIIIDQSDDNRTEKMLSRYEGPLYIKYEHVTFKGLSKARNRAIELMEGDFFCLIDDDAGYSSNYLEYAKKIMADKQKTILCGYIFDLNSNTSLVNYNRIRNCTRLNLQETIKYCPSAGLVFPSTVIGDIGVFDERFGVGSEYGSGEEADYLIRCRKEGYIVCHDDRLKIAHPIRIEGIDGTNEITAQKYYYYSMGKGALYKKHIILYREYELIPSLIENLSKKIVKLLIRKQKQDNIAQIKGLVKGFFNLKKN